MRLVGAATCSSGDPAAQGLCDFIRQSGRRHRWRADHPHRAVNHVQATVAILEQSDRGVRGPRSCNVDHRYRDVLGSSCGRWGMTETARSRRSHSRQGTDRRRDDLRSKTSGVPGVDCGSSMTWCEFARRRGVGEIECAVRGSPSYLQRRGPEKSTTDGCARTSATSMRAYWIHDVQGFIKSAARDSSSSSRPARRHPAWPRQRWSESTTTWRSGRSHCWC